ncbi:acylamino-acid-releasing enzyme-like isoform X4 [Phymastichus coffea]|uniref:acylamino-acid-releasing enzyme-like isoform X4 n=1 Tax=Phymastichus coffea TaxID=108790 RepID=UPI00273CD4E0|nr:acylamino-acid-releasing enzyme-like isoform X4 [Phymastichus coffea]
MSSTQIDKILNIYKRLCQIPTFVSARIIPMNLHAFTVQSIWSQKNMEKHSKQKFLKECSYNSQLELIAENMPVDITTELLTTFSKDEKLKAILRDVTVEGKSKQFIEIWDKQCLNKSYDLSAFDVHGDVYTEPTFHAFQWSNDNTRLLYVAETKLPKCEPFYKQKPKPKPKAEKSNDEEEPSRGTEYIYKPDWGEQLVGKHKSVVVVLNIAEDTIEPITTIPNDYFPAQVLWAPNDSDIIGVAYKLKTKYLGLYSCTNRESYIFQLKGKEFCKITSEGLFCTSPRISPNAQYLIWIERTINPAHNNVERLMYMNLDGEYKPEVLIDTVRKEAIIADGKKFYGLYNQNLPKHCWSVDSKYIFLSTPQRSIIKSYVVTLETKTITEIDNPDGTSLLIADVNKNYLALVKFALTKPSQLTVGKFDSALPNIGQLTLFKDTNAFSIPDGENLMFEHTEYLYETDESVKDFNFTYFGKNGGPDKSTPLIAVGHGGPHSSYCNMYYPDYVLLTLLGFGVLQINYRGSTGLGGDNVDYLLGKIGDVDVRDCVTAIDTALAKYPWLDPKKVNLYGGSHGGFLAAHLSGQYPEKFKSAVILNGVIDIASMYSTTDIPDWCRAGIGFSILEKIPQEGDAITYSNLLLKMLQHSPITYVDKVKIPTLVVIGTKDLRVPSFQGKLWYNRLIENNVPTKLLVYEDNHSLRKDNVDIDNSINVALWFIEQNDQ